MDLHALSKFRPELVIRGLVAFLVGIVLVNQPEASASALVLMFGLWALAEGAAFVWQGYAKPGRSRRSEAQPVLAGVALVAGVLAVVVPGLSAGAVIWVLAAWLAVRAGLEVLGAVVASASARVLMGAAALVDIGLVAILVTHTTGSVVDAAMFSGALVSLWGVLHLVLAALAKPVKVVYAPGPRLLTAR